MTQPGRRTKIIATLGPASSSRRVLRRLLSAGMDVARFNLAHGSESEHHERLTALREESHRLGCPVGVLMDLPGPKIRLSLSPPAPLTLKRHDTVGLGAHASGTTSLHFRPAAVLKDIRLGDEIYIADGRISLKVIQIHPRVFARVMEGGTVSSGNGVNLPASPLKLKAFTPQDQRLLQWGLTESPDFIGLSFTSNGADVERLRRFCRTRKAAPFLIAKIERRLALDRLEDIVQAADGLMVARGDLGVEIPFSQVPEAQNRIIARAREAGRPVILATQVLESMLHQPRPTRAEATDVAHAVEQGVDAVMLSGETALGEFPVQAVEALAEVLHAAEKLTPPRDLTTNFSQLTAPEIVAREMTQTAHRLEAGAVVFPAQDWRQALRIARFRPVIPLLAVVGPQGKPGILKGVWGVRPIVLKGANPLSLKSLRGELRRHLPQIKTDDLLVYIEDGSSLHKGGWVTATWTEG